MRVQRERQMGTRSARGTGRVSLTLRCQFLQRANVARIRRRAHPAYPRSFAAPSLPQFDVTHMVELTRSQQFRSGNQDCLSRVSSVRPTTDKSPLNNAEQIIAGAPSNVGIRVTRITNYASAKK
jgi:hypothetical protein